MRWMTKRVRQDDGVYRTVRRFAWVPVHVGLCMVWLEHYVEDQVYRGFQGVWVTSARRFSSKRRIRSSS